MSVRSSRPLTLALVMPALLAVGCVSGKTTPDDTSLDSDPDVVDTDTVDTDVADTDLLDTDVADTDVADTDVVDTDVVDTDVVDTDPGDTDTATGPWWDSSDTSTETGFPTDTDTGTDTDTTVDTDPPAEPPAEGLTIFLTDAGTSGDFGGVAAADALCNASPARPNDGVYKALLVDGTHRVACTSSDCATGGATEHVDWPLVENTVYLRGSDSAYIHTSDANGLLPFPLTNPIWDTNPEVWTGLSYGWLSSSDCDDWTNVNGYGNVGLGNELDYQFFYKYLQFCNRTNVLMYCAEQLPPGKILFTTHAQPSGDLGGVAGADAACQAAAPTPGNYKALIVDGTSRVACTTADCSTGPGEHVDWPLAAQTLYYRIDSTLIGSTDANGLFLFPLDASPAGRSVEVWTGLNTDWTTGETCAAWTDSTAYGVNGLSDAADDGSIYVYRQFCDRSNVSLYCVQQ